MFTTLCTSIVVAACAALADAAATSPTAETPWSMEDLFGPDRLRGSGPSGLTWMPDGGSFLYRRSVDGDSILFQHDVASGDERKVLNWSATMKALGSQRSWPRPAMDDTNRTGRFAFSPRLSPDGKRMVGLSAGDLWLLELESGEARFLTNTRETELFFRFRPDSAAVGFTRDGDIYAIDLASGEETRLTDRGDRHQLQNGVADWVYEEELDLRQSWWWSPDGTHIAYFQFDVSPVSIFPITDELETVAALERQRYPKTGSTNSRVRLGVLDVRENASGKTLWLASGDAPEGYLVDAEWIDGRNLWYQWLNRDQTQLQLRHVDLTKAAPTTRVLAEERDERWVNVGPDPVFLGDGTFLWTTEWDGWRHLYRFQLADGSVEQLTRGDWEVGSIDGTLAGAAIVSGNPTGAPERHVLSVSFDGSVNRLTTDAGWHSANVAPGGGAWLHSHSTLTTPSRMDLVRSSDGAVLRTIDDGEIPGLAERPLGETRFEELTLADGQKVWTRTIFPPDFDASKRYPVVVYVYGGPGAQVVRNRFEGSRGYYQRLLAQEGAIVFSLDNRGSGGRGRDYARQLHRRLGTLEVEDQIAGARWLSEQPWVDGERIAIYGGSYGGFMTLNCLMRGSEVFSAGVSYAPVTDFRFYDTIYTERYMDTPQDNPEGYSGGAPLEYADGLEDGALLLVHGTMDNNVHLQNSIQMIDRLALAGKSFELMMYPRTRHAMGRSDYRRHFQELSYSFLQRKLGLGRAMAGGGSR